MGFTTELVWQRSPANAKTTGKAPFAMKEQFLESRHVICTSAGLRNQRPPQVCSEFNCGTTFCVNPTRGLCLECFVMTPNGAHVDPDRHLVVEVNGSENDPAKIHQVVQHAKESQQKSRIATGNFVSTMELVSFKNYL
ncbi:unnamed protein product [Clavelina lepadiformis]|uniref:Uncharacterized protein n=1 Tax=Clavelina lepadiformis TaxID=159417 RepID=A0ABP0G2E9_CLALP